ncbi:MAG: DUF4185 domain-containing protein [Candidatus Hadarchaeum sp.]|uniref:DUF4185 domain-containing protein n=1 Tax=Candidatus Hadarchaeum sp. TaxID=2883567 RepID=UPI0031724655
MVEVKNVEMVMQLTGANSLNRTDFVDVWGTDLGVVAESPDGKIYIVFGDTFGSGRPKRGPGGSNWRSNVMAFTMDHYPADGVILDGWIVDEYGRAKELIAGKKNPNDARGEVTKIPTGLTVLDSRLYMAFMSVQHWGAPGYWDVNYSTWAYSDDGGYTWQIVEPPFWGPKSGFVQLAVSIQRGRGNEDGYVLILGTPAGRFGGGRLARVPPDKILDLSAYQYFTGAAGDGTPRWSNSEKDAVIIIPPPVGEASLLWNEWLGCWICAYLDEHRAALMIRAAPYPWGPWSAPNTIVTGLEYPGLYGAFMTPAWTENEGEIVYFLMSQWWEYNVFLMRMALRCTTP